MYDIFFLSDDGSEDGLNSLRDSQPFSQKVLSLDEARERSKTSMYWVVWSGVVVDNEFDFNWKPHDQSRVYTWLHHNSTKKTSLVLFPKQRKITKREIEYRYFVNSIDVGKIATYTIGYDIVFISNGEVLSDDRYDALLLHPGTKTNRVFRVEGVNGIHNAHIEAAKKASTKMVWIVDADAEVVPSFQFSFENVLSPNEEEMVHVWYSRNPVNSLEYGYGGIKLFPREQVLNMPTNSVDMTTSISKDIKIIPVVANITHFNTDPLSTWRSAFRECAKLSSRAIDKQVDDETAQRLNQWCHNTNAELYAEYARSGASAGEWFGRTYKDNKEMLLKINDYNWLAAEFEQHTKMFPPNIFK
ncbi:MAG: hypothetical protein RLZZ196_3011 [Bacteroidota bacterium]|jgi:hypothetical protein